MMNDGIHCLLILSLIVGDLVFSSKPWKAMKAVFILDIADSYLPLLFIENISKVLICQERWMKSSYSFGSCPNLEL